MEHNPSADDGLVDGEVWLRAWVAVAGSVGGKLADCERYADACLAQYRKRFDGATRSHGGDVMEFLILMGLWISSGILALVVADHKFPDPSRKWYWPSNPLVAWMLAIFSGPIFLMNALAS